MDMRADQERRFCALVQNQREDRELFRSWMDREVRAGESPTALAPPTHMPVQKMGPQDDPEAFLDLFEKTAAACGWPQTDWPVRLIPLLTGEAQLAAQQLPVQNLLVYDDLKRAILQRVGRSPEQHRQRFRSLELGENGRPFVMAHQLRDACRRWLLAGEGGVDQIIDRVVLEQFIARLPTKTAQWVQCHRPASLDLAIQLAEDQMVACHGVGETLPSVSLSLPSPSFSPPTFLPRSRAGVVPRAQPRWRGGPAPESTASRAHAREAGSAAAIPVPPVSPRQFLVPLPATRVAGKPGPACWRCGDPGHFIDRCPVMEVGTLVRVPDAPQAAPDQAGGYQIPVSIKGGTYWALVDSGCNQTSIHQSLVQPEALDMSCMVRVRCVHGDVAEYPVVRLAIQFRGQKHNVEVAVNPHLRHPLILGTNWPSFKVLLGVLCADASWGKEKPGREAAVRSGEAEPGLAEAAPGDRNAIERLILTERDDFPLEQSQDESLRNAFEQVRSIDGRPLQPARPPSYPYFAILKDRLYRVTQDAQSKQDTTQLLVPKSRREMLFQAAHCNPMAGAQEKGGPVRIRGDARDGSNRRVPQWLGEPDRFGTENRRLGPILRGLSQGECGVEIRRLSNAAGWRVAWSAGYRSFLFDTGLNERILADPLITIIQRKVSLHNAVWIAPICHASVWVVRGARYLSAPHGQNPPTAHRIRRCLPGWHHHLQSGLAAAHGAPAGGAESAEGSGTNGQPKEVCDWAGGGALSGFPLGSRTGASPNW